MPGNSAWIVHRFEYVDLLGFIPSMLDDRDPRPAKEQLDSGYQHGGGWHKFDGFRFTDGNPPAIHYPGDPPMLAIGECLIRDERVIVFTCSWVMVLQPDGKFEISRMD